jgi:hypothetical protein
MISCLSSLLQQVDPELWYHLIHKTKVAHIMLKAAVKEFRPRFLASLESLGIHTSSVLDMHAGESAVLCFPVDHSSFNTGKLLLGLNALPTKRR